MNRNGPLGEGLEQRGSTCDVPRRITLVYAARYQHGQQQNTVEAITEDGHGVGRGKSERRCTGFPKMYVSKRLHHWPYNSNRFARPSFASVNATTNGYF
jgi:hypothetical protein